MLAALHTMSTSTSSNVRDCHKTLAQHYGPFRLPWQWRVADTFYVPASAKQQFYDISQHLANYDTLHALAISVISVCMCSTSGVHRIAGFNGEPERHQLSIAPEKVLHKALKRTMTHIHPTKVSSVFTKPDGMAAKFYGSHVERVYLQQHNN